MSVRVGNIYYVTHLAYDPAQRADESPAGRNKVMGVCAAIAAAGATPVIVSVLGRTVTRPWIPYRRLAGSAPAHVEIFSPGRGMLRRIVASLGLLWFGLTAVGRDDRVILYNAYPEHLFLALLQRLKGNRCIVDVEDVPFPTGSFANFVERLTYRPILRLSEDRKIVAAAAIARQSGFAAYLPVYGVTNAFQAGVAPEVRFNQDRIAVLLGGTVVEETGAELFLDALALLSRIDQPIPLDLHITGRFDAERFAAAAALANASGKVRVELHRDLSQNDYRALLDRAAVGLSLRVPNSGTAQWTYPSKTIEITASGLLLVTTVVSDIPDIFDEQSAMLLPEASAAALADTLSWIATHRTEAVAIAASGQRLAQRRFSAEAVGAALVPFVQV